MNLDPLLSRAFARRIPLFLILGALASLLLITTRPEAAVGIEERAAACGSTAPLDDGDPALHAPDRAQAPGSSDLVAWIRTSCGTILVDLHERRAPEAVQNFVHLARSGFYDGREWIQVAYDSFIRTGDPNDYLGRKPDDPGYLISPEWTPPDPFDFGALAFVKMNDAGDVGSQFIIAVRDFERMFGGNPRPAALDRVSQVFGQVAPPYFNILAIMARQPTRVADGKPLMEPLLPIYIERVIIENKDESEPDL